MQKNSKKDLDDYIAQLQKLYDQIPSFKCIKNCTDCCGPIFMTGLERCLITEHESFSGATSCPWRGKGFCRIYDKRPMICRLYGTVNEKRLLCSHGKCSAFLMREQTAYQLLLEALDISIAAGFPRIVKTNEALINHFISPSKIPIQLKGYHFNDKI